MRKILFLFFLGWSFLLTAQNSSVLSGRVTGETGKPLADVNILASNGKGTTTDAQGRFVLKLPPGVHRIIISHLGYKTDTLQVRLKPGERKYILIRLHSGEEKIRAVQIRLVSPQEKEGAVLINKKILNIVPGISGGVKNILLSLPSVSQLDELSSQYFVRGGNYDENAVFINGVEIYRPLLARTGKQEGLSMINPDLIHHLHFYAGTFPVTLGDQLTSVLDIHYSEPDSTWHKAELGFTGGKFSAGFPLKNKKFFLGSIRYLNNTLLVKSTEGDAEVRPSFLDFQSLFRLFNGKTWKHEILSYVSSNRYRFVPHTKQTNFGTFADSKSLVIQYNGQEKDGYESQFLALKSDYFPGKKRSVTFIQSLYHSFEREYFDILASYFIGEPNTDLSGDFGDPMNLQALGEDLRHARNLLDAYIVSSEIKYKNTSGKWTLYAGGKYKYENIRSRMREYQVVDSAGFFILPPYSNFHPDEPYVSDTLPVLAYQLIREDYLSVIHQTSAYAEVQKKLTFPGFKGRFSFGLRANYWYFREFDNDLKGRGGAFSPRLLIFGKFKSLPEHFWRFGTGIFMQPPGFKEFRNIAGQINPSVKAQKAFNISLTHEYTFDWKEIPFKITSEIYYRYLWDVNPYAIENVRIRYYALNNAVAYAYGAEFRINGELLPGNQSWLSLAYMKTEQNIDNRGFIPRPTDQRFKMALLFQDYIPNFPQFKMYLNNVFATGLPTGAPFYADPYRFLFRTPNYWRIDIGLFYVPSLKSSRSSFFRKLKDLSIGFEIINAFGRRNSVSNLWVREIYSKRMYGVPNYMIGRIFNLKFKWSW